MGGTDSLDTYHQVYEMAPGALRQFCTEPDTYVVEGCVDHTLWPMVYIHLRWHEMANCHTYTLCVRIGNVHSVVHDKLRVVHQHQAYLYDSGALPVSFEVGHFFDGNVPPVEPHFVLFASTFCGTEPVGLANES